MYLDFDDHRPDTPRVPTVISVREGVLLSLVFHMALVIAILLKPDMLFQPPDQAVLQTPADRQPIRFVEMLPLKDLLAPTPRLADPSDLDRRSATRERAPKPENASPKSIGNTPEKIEGGPTERPAAPPAAPASPDPAPVPAPPTPDAAAKVAAADPTPAVTRSAASAPTLGQSLRNLQDYLRNERFDNQQGGATDKQSDLQFDSKGVDFGPWLRRFKAQVERNWLVPDAAMFYRGHTTIQFYVLRNGFITDLHIIQPAGMPALTTSALSALKLSNPTAALPTEYPDDRMLITATFRYNEYP